jgi:glycosyltransferase involved in cell wall biosynthesis
LTVLLIANYGPDKQQSMIRVADLLESGLRSAGLNVLVTRPSFFFGRILQHRVNLAKWLGYLDKFLLFPFILIQRARHCDLVHIVDHSNAMYRFWLGSKKTVINCNDLLAVRSALGEFSEHRTGVTGKILQHWILAGLRRVEHIACISEATRKDVLRLSGRSEREVTRIYLGLSRAFQAELEKNLEDNIAEADSFGGATLRPSRIATRATSDSSAESEVHDAEERKSLQQILGKARAPYILHIGGEAWYKNRAGVLEIYSRVRRRLSTSSPNLVMVGSPLRNTGGGVVFLEDISDQDLVVLYRNAELLLFPSLYEGFGLPVIEAQACGCPVVTTGKAPLTEIGGDGAAYIANPADSGAAADIVVEVLRFGPAKREQMKKRGLRNASRFSEREIVKNYLGLYQALLAR